jgi:hypothetical protein
VIYKARPVPQGRQYNQDAEELSPLINQHMWGKKRTLYFELTLGRSLVRINGSAALRLPINPSGKVQTIEVPAGRSLQVVL